MGLGLVRVRILFTVAPAARPPSRPARGAAGVVDARAAEHGEGGAELCGRVALLRVRRGAEGRGGCDEKQGGLHPLQQACGYGYG